MSNKIKVIFETTSGDVEILGNVCESLLELAHRNMDKVDLEGACGGALACSTCHVFIAEPWKSKLDEPSEDEEDMLELATYRNRDSRLGCQVILSEDLDGIRVQVPDCCISDGFEL